MHKDDMSKVTLEGVIDEHGIGVAVVKSATIPGGWPMHDPPALPGDVVTFLLEKSL